VVLPLAAGLGWLLGRKGSEQVPLLVGKFVSLHTELEARTKDFDSSDRA
jgi:hypothetical protein